MKFSSWLANDKIEVVRPVVTRVEFTSFALPQIFSRLSVGKAMRVLDLGRAQDSNFNFYRTFCRQIHFEDLAGEIAQHENKTSDSSFAGLELLKAGKKFDLVVCWDVLNYLAADDLRRLSFALSQCTHEKSLVLALMQYQPKVPSVPGNFRIKSADKIEYETLSRKEILGSRYHKGTFKKQVPEFIRERSFLLRNGFEEYILNARALEKPIEVIPEPQAIQADLRPQEPLETSEYTASSDCRASTSL